MNEKRKNRFVEDRPQDFIEVRKPRKLLPPPKPKQPPKLGKQK